MAAERAPKSSSLGSWAALLAVYVLWGSTYTAIQVLVRQVPPLLMAGVRYLLAGLLLYCLLGLLGGGWRLPRRAELGNSAVVGLLLLLGGNGIVSWSEVYLPSGLSALMIATVPLWMTLLAPLFGLGRRRGPLAWLGVGMGMAGVAVLADPATASHASLIPILALLGAALLWSLGSLQAQRAALPASVLKGSAVEMCVGGGGLLAAGLASGEAAHVHLASVQFSALAAFCWLVVMGSIVGFSCYAYALKTMPGSTVATYAYVNPVVALLLGLWLLGQGLNGADLAAAALITAGVVLIVSGPGIWERLFRSAQKRTERMVPIRRKPTRS